jgi:hypothetical protein
MGLYIYINAEDSIRMRKVTDKNLNNLFQEALKYDPSIMISEHVQTRRVGVRRKTEAYSTYSVFHEMSPFKGLPFEARLQSSASGDASVVVAYLHGIINGATNRTKVEPIEKDTASREIEEKTDPLFTSCDGVDIFEGDKYYPVNLFELRGDEYIANKTSENHKGTLRFANRNKAEEHFIMNKPEFSLNDIIQYSNSMTSELNCNTSFGSSILTKISEDISILRDKIITKYFK